MAAHLKAISWLALLSSSWLLATVAQAAVRIGNESAVVTGSNTWFSSALNVRPGNNETVTNNPPVFSWLYNTNHLVGGEMNPNGFDDTIWEWTNSFKFQVATQADFGGTLAINITTPVNAYAMASPLVTNATRQFWARVIIQRTNTAYWTNAWTFFVSATASNLDRSMLSDSGYKTTNFVHPHYCFRDNDRTNVYAWMQTQGPYWKALTNAATAGTNASWWSIGTNWPVNAIRLPTFATPNPADAFTRVGQIGSVMLLWAVSADPRWTNAAMREQLFTNLNIAATWHNHESNNWAMVDYAQPAGSVFLLHTLLGTYDWLGAYTDTATIGWKARTNALWGLRQVQQWYLHAGYFYADANHASGAPSNTDPVYFDWAFPHTRESVAVSSLLKLSISHFAMNIWSVMPVASVAWDTPEGPLFYEMAINYALARTSPYAGFAVHHVGPYGYVGAHTALYNLYYGAMALSIAMPQAQFHRTDFSHGFPEWYSRVQPYRMRKYHGAYGDGLPGGFTEFLGQPHRGLDLAGITRSGYAMQAYNITSNLFDSSGVTVPDFTLLPMRWHFTNTPAPLTNTLGKAYVEDGFFAASSKSPAEFDSYTNGVGFSAHARPRGSTRGHDIMSDLSFDMWAYGANLTDGGGAGLDNYGYKAESSPGLFINGYGEGDYVAGITIYLYSPALPVLAKITHATNHPSFHYVKMEGAGMFTNYWHPLSNIVRSVTREILFINSNLPPYWVVKDTFTATQAITAGFRYHIPWAFRYDAVGAPLSNETEFSGDRMGSNSLVMGSSGFTYVAGNYSDVNATGYANPPRVPVHVAFITTNEGVFMATGVANLGGADATSVIGTANTNSTLNPFRDGGRTYQTVNPDRAAGLWRTNTTAATNRSFVTVIFPVPPGGTAPTIARVDDNTCTVTYGGVTQTNTFGTNYVGAFTYRVEMETEDVGEGEPGPTDAARNASARQAIGRIIIKGAP